MPAHRHHSTDYRIRLDVEEEPYGAPRTSRWLIVVGVALSLVGCAIWMYVLVREAGVADDNTDVVPGVSAPVIGFATMVVGLVLASIGAGRSRSTSRSD